MANQLSEHEPVKQPFSDDNSPNQKDQQVVKMVMTLFDRAKKHRAKYDNKWLKYYKFFRGRQWDVERPSYRHSEVINFTFQAIQSSVPILTDRQQQIQYLPVEPGDRMLARVLNKVVDHDWRRNNWFMSIVENLYDAHIYGTAYGNVEGKMEDGIGKIELESADPFYCFPDPMSTDVNKRGRYFIHAKPLSVSDAKRKYKKIAKKIKPDLIDLVGGDKTELGKARFQSPTDKYSAIPSEPSHDSNEEDQVLEIICYLKDDAIENVRKDGKTLKKLKYPRGRKIVIVSGVLASDKEYPYDDFQTRFAPYAKLQNYVLPREFFGISEVEQLESPQMIFNKLISFVLDVLTLMGNPIYIVDTTSGIDPENLINRPGLVIEKERGSEVRRESGVQLQPYVIQIIDRMQAWFNDMAGQTDISSGAVPSGVTSGRAISAVQEAARTRLRLKSKLIDLFIQDLGQMYLSRLFQFYSAPRIFRITNDEGSFDFFKMSVEQTEDSDKKIVRIRNILQDEEGNLVDGEEQVFETAGNFDVLSSSGSSLPFAKFEQAQQSYQLFDRQVIDAEALLTDIDYPNKEAVLERLQEQQEQAAALAQEQAAMQAQGLPPQQ